MIPADDRFSRSDAPSADDSRVIQALRQYLAAAESGRKPDRRGFLARFPEIAGPLAECLDSLEFVHTAAPHLNGLSGSQPLALPGGIDLQPAQALGDFRILREVGRGGMGVVYEAEQLSLRRRVALKVLPFAAALDPKQLQRFLNEAHAAAHLHHTNIVPVHAIGSERGVHYYAMQYIEGQSLAALIRGLRSPAVLGERGRGSAETKTMNHAPPGSGSHAPTPPRPHNYLPDHCRAAARLGAEAAAGLEHAHRQGIVHRDIKPANLLIDVRGNLWIADFGLACFQAEAGPTLTGDLVGTLRYMSPEQALALRGRVDHRSDIYSLGVTLYELLTLEPAFGSDDRQELLQQIAYEEPRPPRRVNPAVPADLQLIVQKAMAKDVEDRYTTAQELADDLRRFLDDKPIKARRPTLFQRTMKYARRHRRAVGAAAGLLLLAVVGLATSTVLIWKQKDATEAALKRARFQESAALVNAQEARKQRERAEANFRRVLASVTHMLTQFEEKRWEKVREISEVRRTLADAVQRSLQGYVEICDPEPSLRYETAMAHVLVGNVCRLQGYAGSRDKALESYKKAITQFEQLVEQYPENISYMQEMALCYNYLGVEAGAAGDRVTADEAYKKASKLYEQAIDKSPTARSLNNFAWFLVTCPDEVYRDPKRAVPLAERAVDIVPACPLCRNTLGVARYRAGDYKGAVEDLEQSMRLNEGGDSFDWLYLAMAHHRLGNTKKARFWYLEALKRINRFGEPLSPHLAEATALLGKADKKPCQLLAW